MSHQDDEDFDLSDLMNTALDYDINKVPDTFKSAMIEQLCAMNNFLVDSLEDEGKLMEMLTWSKDRIKSYESAIIQKHLAEKGHNHDE